MLNMIKSTDLTLKLAAFAVLSLFAAGLAFGQTNTPLGTGEPGNAAEDSGRTPQSAAELDELVGPIALYPDDLIAIVLPASTFPLQIVQASRYLKEVEVDDQLKPDADWDDSIVALLNYPEVLELLNDDLDRTWALGEAVIYQQDDVLNSIQTFRNRTYAAGNLATDKHQVVTAEDDGSITIKHADPEVIYVPYYDPARVVVHEYVPLYYYPYGYPVYYYPYPFGYSFGAHFFWGVTTAFAISWNHHYLHVHHHSHIGHPYYGYNYYRPWYARTNIYVNVNRIGGHDRWRPGYRHGNRPHHQARFTRQRDRVIANAHGPTGTARAQSGLRDERNAGNRQPRRATQGRALDNQRDRRVRANSRPERNIGDRYRRSRSNPDAGTTPQRDEARSQSRGRGDARSQSRARGEARSQSRGRGEARSQSRGRGEARSQSRGRDEARSQSRGRDEARSQSRARGEARSQNRARGEARSQSRGRGEARSQSRGRGEARSQSRGRGEAHSQSRSRGEARSQRGHRSARN